MIFFQWQALRIFAVTAAAAILTELAAKRLLKSQPRLYDGSVLITALLLTLMMPPNIPSWQAALGSAFAVSFGKEIFGGLGQNPFNPVLVGRAFLGLCFPSTSSFPVPLAESLTAGILIGAAILLSTRSIRWEIPLLYLGSVLIFSWAMGRGGEQVFLSGSIFLAAFFIVTDPVTTPTTRLGERWFAFGSGFLTVLIRERTSFADGATYGILVMNALSPRLDDWLRPSRARKAL